MKFSYCPVCGTKLVKRLMDDEGVAPYCDTCHRPRFDLFKVAVIGLVENECGEVALIRQRSFSSCYESLVSGFVAEGERAEDALRREITEELGIAIEGMRFEGTHWFEAKGILMMGFFARAPRGRWTAPAGCPWRRRSISCIRVRPSRARLSSGVWPNAATPPPTTSSIAPDAASSPARCTATAPAFTPWPRR